MSFKKEITIDYKTYTVEKEMLAQDFFRRLRDICKDPTNNRAQVAAWSQSQVTYAQEAMEALTPLLEYAPRPTQE